MQRKIQRNHVLTIIRKFVGSFLLMLGLYKVLQDLFDFVDQLLPLPYIIAMMVALWSTVEVVKEIRKNNAQLTG